MSIQEDLEDLIDKIKNIFDLGGDDIIGLDIGLSAVKVAQIQKKGTKYRLTNYAAVSLPEFSMVEDEIQKEEEIIAAIVEALAKARVSSKTVAIGLFGPRTIAKKLQLPPGEEDDIEDQIVWEAEQYIPFGIDDSKFAYEILAKMEGGSTTALIAAAHSDVVEIFRRMVVAAGAKVKIVDLGVLAIYNIFELVMQEQIKANPGISWLLIDFGAQKSSIIIIKDGMFVFAKEASIGGVMFTEEIQRKMGVNYLDAENLKTTYDDNGNLPEEVMKIIVEVLEVFFEEIKKTVDFYLTSTSDDALSRCVISGGSARVPGLMQGLEQTLSLPITFLNPLEVIEHDEANIPENMLEDIAFAGTVVLGLAIRGHGND